MNCNSDDNNPFVVNFQDILNVHSEQKKSVGMRKNIVKGVIVILVTLLHREDKDWIYYLDTNSNNTSLTNLQIVLVALT